VIGLYLVISNGSCMNYRDHLIGAITVPDSFDEDDGLPHVDLEGDCFLPDLEHFVMESDIIQLDVVNNNNY
jgi:hypothetical protein